jgi:hypothetical protein
VNVSVPVKVPDVVGMHSTPTLHIPLGANEPSQVSLDLTNGGAVRMLAMSIVTFLDLLVASTVCCGLVLPTGTLPKLRLLGLTLRFAFPFGASLAKTGADAPRPIVRSRVKNPSAKSDDFVRDMAFLPRNKKSQRVFFERPLTSRPTEFLGTQTAQSRTLGGSYKKVK